MQENDISFIFLKVREADFAQIQKSEEQKFSSLIIKREILFKCRIALIFDKIVHHINPNYQHFRWNITTTTATATTISAF